jgi:hypothetical protein
MCPFKNISNLFVLLAVVFAYRSAIEPLGAVERYYQTENEEGVSKAATEAIAQINAKQEICAQVERIVNHLYTAEEKAYTYVGITKEDVQRLFATQAPPQKLMDEWKAYREARPAIAKAREAAIEEMASLGPDAVPALLKLPSKSMRGTSQDYIFVAAITMIGEPAVPAVVDGLSHPDTRVRVRAAFSLGKICDRRAVEPLVRTLTDSHREVSSAVAWSLGVLADPRAVEPLLNLWNKQHTVARSRLAWALGSIGDKRAVEPIMAALGECVSKAEETGNWDVNSWDMRMYAGALGRIGDNHAIPVLKRALKAGPQKTKASTAVYMVAEAAAKALRSLGVEVTGDRRKGKYEVVEVAPPAEVEEIGGIQELAVKQGSVRQGRDYEAARNIPQPIELWKVKEYGCGGNPRTQQKLRTDVKRQYPILLTWPLIQEAGKYVVQIRGVRGSRPAISFESVTNRLRLEEADIVPGRYLWSVSVYDKHGSFMGDVETINPVEVFAIADPKPVAANGRKVLIDLNHSAGHLRGWGYYNHAQYMTKELLENAGFEVEVNKRDLLTTDSLKSVDLLLCHYYWTGWPGFRSYVKSELSAVREFVENGGSLLVVGCDRKDRGGKMSEAGNELIREFGLMFELDEISKQVGLAKPAPDQNVISFDKPVKVQLPVSVQGEDAITPLWFDGLPLVKAKQFGRGKIIVAGVGMSFLDCYLGDFEHREPLHLIMFYDFIRYLAGIDWVR